MDLPPEVLMLIFSYLRINDLRIEASCVFEKPIIYREKINF